MVGETTDPADGQYHRRIEFDSEDIRWWAAPREKEKREEEKRKETDEERKAREARKRAKTAAEDRVYDTLDGAAFHIVLKKARDYSRGLSVGDAEAAARSAEKVRHQDSVAHIV